MFVADFARVRSFVSTNNGCKAAARTEPTKKNM